MKDSAAKASNVSSNSLAGKINEDDVNAKKKTSLVEILDFNLESVKQEKDYNAEDHTMELELKVEIEHEAETSNSEYITGKDPNMVRIRNNLNTTGKYNDQQDVEHCDADRPLPPPLMSKPIGTNHTSLSSLQHSLQPPPLMINPRLSNEGKSHMNLSSSEVLGNQRSEEEILKIKREIRDDIQSELMDTSGEMGGIGNAVAASFRNPFRSVESSEDSTSSNISSSGQTFRPNTTSLLPRSATNNQMYISKLNTFTTTSSYVNLPLCTPSASVSTGTMPMPILTRDGKSCKPLHIDTEISENGRTQVAEQSVTEVTQNQHLNGAHCQNKPTGSNEHTLLSTHPAQAVQNAQQQRHSDNNQVKTGLIGQDVREKLVKHLEDKNGEIQIIGSTNEMPPLISFSDGQFSPSPNNCNKGTGKIIS